ncbi:MAG: hypothetical protein ACK5IA_05970 [Cyanobacteriota bacterium]
MRPLSLPGPVFRTGLVSLGLCALLLPPAAPAAPEAPVIPANPADTATPAAPDSEASSDPWAGTLELSGFAPIRTTGSTTVRGFTADTDLWLGDLIPLIRTTGSARASVEKGRLGLLADISYTRIGDDLARTSPRGPYTGKATVTSNLGITDLALRYRFGDRESAVASPGRWSVIPYAGVRLVYSGLGVGAEILSDETLQPLRQRQGELSKFWAQPLLGTQATLFLSPRLRAFGRADVGGFGLAGARDLSGNAQLGLGYAIGNNTDLNVSWRYQGIAYDNGSRRSSGFTNYQNGVELGVKFFF